MEVQTNDRAETVSSNLKTACDVFFNSVWIWCIPEDTPHYHHHQLADCAIQGLQRQNDVLKFLNTSTLIHFISLKSQFSTTAHRIQIRTGTHQGSKKMSFELHLVSLFFSIMLPQHIVERSSESAKWQQYVLVCVCCTGTLKCL